MVMTVMAGAAGVPHALDALQTAIAVAVLCMLAAGEIVATPGRRDYHAHPG